MIQLPQPPDEIMRELIYENWEAKNVNGYDVTIADPSNSDFLPLTTDWYAFGDVYPSIALTNFNDTTLGGGETGYTGLQGSGDGANKQTNTTGLLTIQAEDEAVYDGLDGQEMLRLLKNEIERIIGDKYDGVPTDKNGNVIQFGAGAYNTGTYGSGTYGTDQAFQWFEFQEQQAPNDQEEDRTLLQTQYQVGFGWNNEPHP